jgi:hypothetical protein
MSFTALQVFHGPTSQNNLYYRIWVFTFELLSLISFLISALNTSSASSLKASPHSNRSFHVLLVHLSSPSRLNGVHITVQNSEQIQRLVMG